MRVRLARKNGLAERAAIVGEREHVSA